MTSHIFQFTPGSSSIGARTNALAAVFLFTGWVGLSSTAFAKDPIPGGGVVRATGVRTNPADPANLDICLPPGVQYLGASLTTADDQSVLELLTGKASAEWELQLVDSNGEMSTICKNGCSPAIAQEDGGPFLRLTTPSADVLKGVRYLRILFRAIGAQFQTGRDSELPTIEANVAGGWHCPALMPPTASPATVEQMKRSDPSDDMAFIAYPSRFGGIHTCSGIMIAEDAVLTAAHCFDETPVDIATVTVLVKSTPYQALGSARAAKSVTRHPSYKAPMLSHDLAVVKLAAPVGFNKGNFVLGKPIKGDGCDVVSYGFGIRTNPKAPFYDHGVLNMVPLTEIAPDACSAKNLAPCADPNLFLALGSAVPDKGLCRGDSGGAVFKRCEGIHYLVALASARVGAPEQLPLGGMGSSSVPAPQLGKDMVVSSLTAPIAFSKGNICGSEAATGFLAARISPEHKTWIDCVLSNKLCASMNK